VGEEENIERVARRPIHDVKNIINVYQKENIINDSNDKGDLLS
jgi:hypothetical protein